MSRFNDEYTVIYREFEDCRVADLIGEDHKTWRVRDHLTYGKGSTPSGMLRFRAAACAPWCRMSTEDVDRSVDLLASYGFCELSADREWLWVIDKAEVQFSPSAADPDGKAPDKRFHRLWADVGKCRDPELLARFVARYGESRGFAAVRDNPAKARASELAWMKGFTVTGERTSASPSEESRVPPASPPQGLSKPSASPPGALPEPLPSHIQIQVQKQIQQQVAHPPAPAPTHTCAPAREDPAAATAAAGGTAAPATAPERKPRAQDEVPPAERDPWPGEASEAAAKRWTALCESDGKVPRGDSVEPFERAALLLRDKHAVPPDEVSATLVELVERAHRDPKRIHPKHGDLFTDSRRLLGGQGAIPPPEKVAAMYADLVEARLSAPKPKPKPSLQVVEDDGFRLPRYTPEELALRPKWVREGYLKGYAMEDARDAAKAAAAASQEAAS